MSILDTLAGSASPGTLYGIGVGPGDARYLTLRAAGLVRAVDVLAYFAKTGSPGNARRIVTPLVEQGRAEHRFEYPVTDEVPADSVEYQHKIGTFYRETAA
ncbi:MAG: precorrin-2 C(20)-methyltransferase, partial [Reyranella sp.]|nr:precorrin-2 C(20)-methyltransferase [Reyranella sp.]